MTHHWSCLRTLKPGKLKHIIFTIIKIELDHSNKYLEVEIDLAVWVPFMTLCCFNILQPSKIWLQPVLPFLRYCMLNEMACGHCPSISLAGGQWLLASGSVFYLMLSPGQFGCHVSYSSGDIANIQLLNSRGPHLYTLWLPTI